MRLVLLLTLIWCSLPVIIFPSNVLQLHLLSRLPSSVLFLCQQLSLLSQLLCSGPLSGLFLLTLIQAKTGKTETVTSTRSEEEGRLVFITVVHLFLQQGSFPHSLSSFFLSLPLLLLLPPPLLLYETLCLGLLLGLLLCPPALQLIPTLPGCGRNFSLAILAPWQRLCGWGQTVTFPPPLSGDAPAPLSPSSVGLLSSFQPGAGMLPLGQ